MRKVCINILKSVVCIFIIIAIVFGVNYYSICNIKINNYDVYSSDLPTNFNQYKIAFITDFHNATYCQQLIEKTKNKSPDVILIGGDMVNVTENEYNNSLELLNGLRDVAPMYMVMGNHEIFHPKLEQIKIDFGKCGVNFLNNQGVKLYDGENYISLYGFKDPAMSDKELKDAERLRESINVAKYGVDENTFSLMVMHRANMFDMTYELGYDLVLSGHMHGGVVRLPFLGGMFTPEREQLFPQYTKGLYYLGKSKMIVSAGLDKQKSKPRFFNAPELVMITLKKG